MLDIHTLITVADAYKIAAKIENDSTVSHRVFGDTKKLAGLRSGADITVGRFNSALRWFWKNWPEGAMRPPELVKSCSAPSSKEGAA